MICPLCNCSINDVKHVTIDHEAYWKSKGFDAEILPKTIEEFNNRFGTIGLKILEKSNEN